VIQFGIDRLIGDIKLLRELEGRRVALLAHPASMTADFEHSLDALRGARGLDITAAFGPGTACTARPSAIAARTSR